MSSCFPDTNVWLALLLADHIHRPQAVNWWNEDESESIVFCRLTQIGVLRLLTTAPAMNGRPLSMNQAWNAYDRLFADPRVVFLSEPVALDREFRSKSSGRTSSPKLWTDAWLSAFASTAGLTLVTFDKTLAGRTLGAHLLATGTTPL